MPFGQRSASTAANPIIILSSWGCPIPKTEFVSHEVLSGLRSEDAPSDSDSATFLMHIYVCLSEQRALEAGDLSRETPVDQIKMAAFPDDDSLAPLLHASSRSNQDGRLDLIRDFFL